MDGWCLVSKQLDLRARPKLEEIPTKMGVICTQIQILQVVYKLLTVENCCVEVWKYFRTR